jgi:hypothetical protein
MTGPRHRSPVGLAATIALGVAFTAGCGGGGGAAPQTSLPAPKAPVEGHLLAFPQGDGEGLLGRAVTRNESGGYRIADERAAGCEVLVRRNKAAFHSSRETETSKLATLDAGYQALLALSAKYGDQSKASLELDNTQVLEADLRGACGTLVVSKVFVGTGKRRVFAANQASAKASLTGPVAVSPSYATQARDVDEISWQDDQAYAFDVRELTAESEAVRVDVQLPSIVTEGDEVSVAFTSAQEAFLVVLYVDADGKADVLWPSNEEPVPRVTPTAKALLPSVAERAAGILLRPTLARPGAKAREQLVVYAFRDRGDFDLLKPSALGAINDGAAHYEERLAERLRHVPAHRWSRAVLGYTIEPKR